ncbi:two-component system response regulator [Chitinibacter sp. GC72]|uniref:response regulator n=1 Tax=Chitinibacter sp. GC72 TaxID=1526917 RepID=UPI0012FA24B6|nr:response regulator [Chitinibacter sp. GC72]
MSNMLERQTILIVDDTPDVLSLLTTLLKDNYKTQIATNGINALEILAKPPYPDLILMDVLMPEMGGYETCQRIRETPSLADIPIIFLSSISENQDVAMGLALGATDFIVKPIFPAILLSRVAVHMSLRRKIQLLEAENQQLRVSLDAVSGSATEAASTTEDETVTPAIPALAESASTNSPIALLRQFALLLEQQDAQADDFLAQYRKPLAQIIPSVVLEQLEQQLAAQAPLKAKAQLNELFHLP